MQRQQQQPTPARVPRAELGPRRRDDDDDDRAGAVCCRCEARPLFCRRLALGFRNAIADTKPLLFISAAAFNNTTNFTNRCHDGSAAEIQIQI